MELAINITLVVPLGCCNTTFTSPAQVWEKPLIFTLLTATPDTGNPVTTRLAGEGVAGPTLLIVIFAGLVNVTGFGRNAGTLCTVTW